MKRLILGMSMERKVLLSKIDSLVEPIGEHICKIILYHDIRQDSIAGWIHEIGTKLEVISEITCKPKNKKLPAKEYAARLLNYFGDSEPDMKLSLIAAEIQNSKKVPPYPHVEVTRSEVSNSINFVNHIVEVISKMLADDKNYESIDFEQVISDGVREYVKV